MEIEMSKDECQTIIDALKIARLSYLRLSQVGTEENRMLKKAEKTAKLIDDFEKFENDDENYIDGATSFKQIPSNPLALEGYDYEKNRRFYDRNQNANNRNNNGGKK